MSGLDLPDDLPDAGGGMCCYGAAGAGPANCTCWENVYDRDQAEPQEGPSAIRGEMCGDCAFRPNSPERSGDQRYAHAGDEIAELPFDHTALFVCHQGMRRRTAMVHEPTGVRHEILIDAYEPGGGHEHPCKADGTPADVCAGFWAARVKAQALLDEGEPSSHPAS